MATKNSGYSFSEPNMMIFKYKRGGDFDVVAELSRCSHGDGHLFAASFEMLGGLKQDNEIMAYAASHLMDSKDPRAKGLRARIMIRIRRNGRLIKRLERGKKT